MLDLVCKRCGAQPLEKKNGMLVCPYCGSTYALNEDEQKAFQSINNKTSSINLKSDVEVLLEKCRKEPHNARKYAGLVLDIDPTNREARKYL